MLMLVIVWRNHCDNGVLAVPELCPDEGLRRSKRTRVQPLDWYRCERIQYQYNKLGMISWRVFFTYTLTSLYISGTAKARNVKFGMQKDYKEFYQKKCKIKGQRGRGLGHVTYF